MIEGKPEIVYSCTFNAKKGSAPDNVFINSQISEISIDYDEAAPQPSSPSH
jgi:hypothetical protein